MNYTPQIVSTFADSSVERILIIDDAYDPPELDRQSSGDLLDILSAGDFRSRVDETLLDEEVREAAIEALTNNELEDSAIPTATAGLYQVFVDERAASVDPGGVFAATKGSALGALEPLLELLHHCQDDSPVLTVGKNNALNISSDFKPHLIFMDFFLSPPTGAITNITAGSGGTQSTKLLRSILSALCDDLPAVVLMSSQDVTRYKDTYFSQLDNKMTGFRFGFLHKSWVQGRGQELTVSGDAADVLMDTAGSFEFGRALEAALVTWKDGAEKALRRLYAELREFDVKDFAYLLKFRLYEEGEPFADYLEWFVGESLRAIVDDEVDWSVEEFSQLNDRTLASAIEGAHPLPSEGLAKFFHRMRFNSRASRVRNRLFLGDVFVSSDHEHVRMVVSPDCDLVSRRGNRAASRVLTIGGDIQGLNDGGAAAGDLIYDDSPKVIKWNRKDQMTHEFGDLANLRVGDSSYTYFASMRPMFAQAIQKSMVADLSRVGLPVPPTVDIGAPVTVHLKKNVDNQAQVVEIDGLEESYGQVILPRGGRDRQMRVLFTRRFLRELLAKLEELTDEDLPSDYREHWRNWTNQAERVRRAMLREGVKLPGEGVFKLVTSTDGPRGRSWLEIVVDISEEAQINMRGMDPLVS